MDTLWHDLRYGIKMLRTNPSFTFVAVLTLALGIGANTAIFSVVNAILLRPLPYKASHQIMYLSENNQQRGIVQSPASAPNYLDWKSQNQSFVEMAAYDSTIFNYTAKSGAERLDGSSVSSNFFSLLGEQPLRGRTFQPEDEQPGHDNVIVISETFWQRDFGAYPEIIGSSLLMGTRSYTVIGIMPAKFKFPFPRIEVWKPLAFDNAALQNRTDYRLGVLARLKSTVSQTTAQEEMDTIARNLQEAYPTSNAGWSVSVKSLHEALVGNAKPALLVLMSAVFFVLLIACVNVASLLSARLASRQKEISLRVALGATKARLTRQLLTESVVLSSLGGIGGVLLAFWGLGFLLKAVPSNVPRISEVSLDYKVLAFTLLISIATGIIFGLAPSLQMNHADLNSVLKESSRASTGGKTQKLFHNLIVISEVFLSLILLISAGLLLRSFASLRNIDPGFRTEGVLVNTQLVLPPAKYGKNAKGVAFFKELFERLQALPGIESVGGITALPLQSNSRLYTYAISGQPPRPAGQELTAVINVVGGDYFKTLGITLKQGRLFTEHDQETAPKVALINEALARRDFYDQNPIGQRLFLDGGDTPYEIIGVVGDTKQFGLKDPALPEVFTHYLQTPVTFMYVLTHTSGDPSRLGPAIRSQVQAIDPDQPVGHRTLGQQLDNAIAQPRFYTILLGVFAALALILAAVGIYGVMSFSVTRRTPEIGIRMALGAQRHNVLKLIMGEGIKVTVIGMVAGLAAATGLTRFLSSLLYGISATDLLTYFAIASLLTVVALLACYIPARRATKVDPLIALRSEY